MGENNSSVCSQSLILDTRSSSPDHQAYYPHKPCSGPTAGNPKGPPIKFPLIPRGSRHSPSTPSAADEEEQREEEEEQEEDEGDEESCCSTEGEREEAQEGGSSLRADWTEERSQKRRTLMRSPHDTHTLQREELIEEIRTKYFETKKATVPLDETLRNLRQELETFYNKLLHQLQARDGRLRKQAATELRALKAELAQKKSQSSHTGPLTSHPFGLTPRTRLYAQKTGS
ncbi:hypothetical protein NHX12_033303 [Muraenolepis orangiensis]|uniref:Spermatogenesis-associated protein 1 C-terminal domain-containing protein n=1 Tax=Muraenolepis orangiensis TaxID=630683 RepID=A0A9Q0E2E1_9TELE|nr:hypothetical protein NHX12_033303 [Muraenolepis orangiensis]